MSHAEERFFKKSLEPHAAQALRRIKERVFLKKINLGGTAEDVFRPVWGESTSFLFYPPY